MRLRTALPYLLAAVVLIATPSAALEKTAVRLSDRDPGADWTSAKTCTLTYYNICTGWLWNWSDWEPLSMLGVTFEAPGSPVNTVQSSSFYVWTAAPSGWGFVGTISVHETDDNGCPTGPPIESQTFDPISGWNTYGWSAGVGNAWAIVLTLGYGAGSPMVFPTDHPAAGPTGPQACGLCYPMDRPNHSFRWGTSKSTLCPGSSFHDGVCDAQLWARCSYTAEHCGPVPVKDESWTTIKALYR